MDHYLNAHELVQGRPHSVVTFVLSESLPDAGKGYFPFGIGLRHPAAVVSSLKEKILDRSVGSFQLMGAGDLD